ncbi:MAG: hypothetical protein Q4C73_11570, partial [Eubacteriales bacterium]|nr:hypothetical protein [Eubacteriales bacterium]
MAFNGHGFFLVTIPQFCAYLSAVAISIIIKSENGNSRKRRWEYMISNTLKKKYTGSYQAQLKALNEELHQADAVLIGAGAGLSTSAGFTYSGERFERLFGDFIEKYHISDMYAGGFYPWQS